MTAKGGRRNHLEGIIMEYFKTPSFALEKYVDGLKSNALLIDSSCHTKSEGKSSTFAFMRLMIAVHLNCLVKKYDLAR